MLEDVRNKVIPILYTLLVSKESCFSIQSKILIKDLARYMYI